MVFLRGLNVCVFFYMVSKEHGKRGVFRRGKGGDLFICTYSQSHRQTRNA